MNTRGYKYVYLLPRPAPRSKFINIARSLKFSVYTMEMNLIQQNIIDLVLSHIFLKNTDLRRYPINYSINEKLAAATIAVAVTIVQKGAFAKRIETIYSDNNDICNRSVFFCLPKREKVYTKSS